MRLARLLKGAHRLWPPTREEAGEKGRLMLLPRRHWLPSAGNNAVLFSPGSSSDQQNGPALLLLGFGDNAQFCHTSSLPLPSQPLAPFSSPTLHPTTQQLELPFLFSPPRRHHLWHFSPQYRQQERLHARPRVGTKDQESERSQEVLHLPRV